MSSKGQSNQYGNTNGSNGSVHQSHNIGYKYAKDFSRNGRAKHYEEHGKEFNSKNIDDYVTKAIKFSNFIDRKNCVSFIQKGTKTTFKFNKKTNEFVIVDKNGIVISYHHIKGMKEFRKIKKEEKNEKKRYR